MLLKSETNENLPIDKMQTVAKANQTMNGAYNKGARKKMKLEHSNACGLCKFML